MTDYEYDEEVAHPREDPEIAKLRGELEGMKAAIRYAVRKVRKPEDTLADALARLAGDKTDERGTEERDPTDV